MQFQREARQHVPSGLHIPQVRIFQDDGKGTTAFLGEDWGKYTPLEDEMKLYLGLAQDVAVVRTIEKKLEAHRKELEALELILADTTLYSDPARKDELAAIIRNQADVKSAIETQEWDWLAAKLPGPEEMVSSTSRLTKAPARG